MSYKWPESIALHKQARHSLELYVPNENEAMIFLDLMEGIARGISIVKYGTSEKIIE